jgi:hypothetical protein
MPLQPEYSPQERALRLRFFDWHVGREGRKARGERVTPCGEFGEQGEDHSLDGDVVLGENESSGRVESAIGRG